VRAICVDKTYSLKRHRVRPKDTLYAGKKELRKINSSGQMTSVGKVKSPQSTKVTSVAVAIAIAVAIA